MLRTLISAWVFLIIGLSFLPFAIKMRLTIGPFHNAGHFFVFLVGALLACWETNSANSRLLRCAGLLVLALILEGVEKIMTYKNPFEWRDIAFDCIGILAGLLSSYLLPMRSTAKRTAG
jgi:peptidoglycan/LPS O-acetylase OafA/YrhL